MMFEDRAHKRTFSGAPQSVTSLVAAFMEPAIAVLVYLAVKAWFDMAVDRADLTLCLLVFALTFPGPVRFRDRQLDAAVDISSSWLSLLFILGLCGYATQSLEFFDLHVLFWWAVLAPVCQMLACMLGRRVLQHQAGLAQNHRVAVVVGAGPLGLRVAQSFQARIDTRVDFRGYFEDRTASRLEPDTADHLIGNLNRLSSYIAEHGVQEVYITLPLGTQPRIIELLAQLQGTTASVLYVPDVFGITIIQGRIQDMNGLPVVGLCETPFTGTNQLVKRLSDVALSATILVLTAPLLLAIAAAVKLSSPGPAIFKQRRNGLGGEEIVVYKFRSMTASDTTGDDGAAVPQARRQDPRVTRLGAFLRKTSLDELPQFVNVLQGRMSIVGPRPHAVAHNEQYRQLIKAYMVRHKVKPGITGWAQIHGHRGETDTVQKMQARVEYDLEYLRNWSLALDFQIVARTIKLVFFDRNAY